MTCENVNFKLNVTDRKVNFQFYSKILRVIKINRIIFILISSI